MKTDITRKVVIVLLLFVCSVPIFATGWQKEDEFDEFGDPTGKYTVFLASQEGTYSSTGNGAKNSKMTWSFYYSKATSKCWFVIKEGIVDANLSTAKYTSDKYSISIKGDDGNVYKWSGQIKSNGGVYNAILVDSISVAYAIASKNSVKIVISADNGSGSYNLGTVESAEFKNLAFESYGKIEKLINEGKYDDAYSLLNYVLNNSFLEYDWLDYSELEEIAQKKKAGI